MNNTMTAGGAPLVDRARTLERLPEPAYETHPAYGGAFPPPTIALRCRALARLLPWLAMVTLKRLLVFDQLPPLPDYDGPMSGGIARRLAALPRYVPYIARGVANHWSRRILGARPPLQAASTAQTEAMRRTGAISCPFAPADMDAILGAIAGPLAALFQRRDSLPTRTFEGNQTWLNRREAAKLYAVLDQVLGRCGLLDTASAYLGRTAQITHLTLQVNDSQDGFHHNKFSDVGLPDPATNYMHVDTTDEILKCMIYLNEVGEHNGPFCYVRGSARVHVGLFEGLVRRAVDRSGLSGYSRASRELFMALPKPLRRKCTFGSDLTDGSADANAVLGAEYRFTSADGDAILFDNLGIHRGALVTKGERRILVATLA